MIKLGTWLLNFLAVALAAYCFFMTAVFAYLISDLFVAPQQPIALELIEKKIKQDEKLKYLAVFRRNKPCRSDIQRFVIYKDKAAVEALEQQGVTGTVVAEADGARAEFVGYRDSLIGIITQGTGDIIKTVSVMEHPPFPIGHYVLRIFVISTCAMITRIDVYPDAPFEVVE